MYIYILYAYLICSSFFILSIPFFFVLHPPKPGQSKATAWFVGPGIRCCCKNNGPCIELKLSMDHAFSNHSNLAFLPWESVAPLPFHLYPPRFEGEKMKSVSKVLGFTGKILEDLGDFYWSNWSARYLCQAGYGLLQWVLAMVKYYEVAKGVAPKRELVNKLQQKKEEAEEHLGCAV